MPARSNIPRADSSHQPGARIAMSHRSLRLRVVLSSSLALTLGSIATSLGDVVTLTSDATTKGAAGGIVRGQVTSESPTKVEVKLGNTVTSIPTNEVVSINYDNHPASLDQALAKEAANALQEAADLFKKAAADASTRPFIAEDAAFGQARALSELAQTDPARAAEAISLLETFSRSYKAGRHVGPALEALAKLQIARDNFSGLETTLAALAQLPKGDDRSAIFRIKVLTKKGQLEQALAELDKLIASAPEGSTKRRDAQLSKAENLVALKKFADAEATVRAVIKGAATEDAATQALAHNTLGDCLRAAGKSKEALYAYLHTDLLFSREKDEHARALAQIALIWRELNRADRADEALERLKQEYPRSPYATSAK